MPLTPSSRFCFLFYFILLSYSSYSQTGYHEGLKAEKSGNVWGFKNTKNKWAILPQFDSIQHAFEFGKAIVKKGDLYGVIDIKGNTTIPFIYHEILPEYKHLFPVKNKEGKWGFIHTDGKEIFPVKYDNFRYEYKDKHILLQELGKWGIFAVTGEEMIAPHYKQIFYQQKKTYKALPFSQYEILSESGKVICTIEAENIQQLSKDFFSYSILHKKGICSATKKLCPAVFDEIIFAKDSLFFVKKNNRWGIASMNGQLVQEPVWEILDIQEHCFIIQNDQKEKQIYSWSFKSITSDTFKEIAPYNHNSNWIVKNKFNLWGVINEKGEQLISYRYDSIFPFEKGIAQAILQGNKIIINEKGEQLISKEEYPYYNAGIVKLNTSGEKEWMNGYQEYTTVVQLSYHYYRVQLKNKRFGIVDDKGLVILPCQYDAIHLSTDNNILITRQGLKHMLYNTKGQLISGPHKRFDDVIDVSEEYIKIKYKGGLGFCDLEGRIMISTQYEETGLFKNGICPVKLRGRWGYIDKEEKIIVQPYYQAPALFYGSTGIIQENNLYHLMNDKGKLTLEYPLKSVVRTSDGLYLIQNQTGLYGLANQEGKEVIPTKYHSIKPIENGLFLVGDEYHTGAMDKTGRIVIPIKYNTLCYAIKANTYCGEIKRDWQTITIK